MLNVRNLGKTDSKMYMLFSHHISNMQTRPTAKFSGSGCAKSAASSYSKLCVVHDRGNANMTPVTIDAENR